jgi:glycerate 2-kinase
MSMRSDAEFIMQEAIKSVLPDQAVARALEKKQFGTGKIILVSIGKAGWQMAKTAVDILGTKITKGIVITKYEHSKGDLPGVEIWEAGHPVPDSNSFKATAQAIAMVQNLKPEDTVVFLISGGGSALFEKPLIPEKELQQLTNDLLASGADIVEMNTIRKRVSAVKGGKFAQLCAPAKVYAVVLSDIIGDPLDMIASGPAYPDSSTSAEAQAIVAKYHLKLSPAAQELLKQETPKNLTNVTTEITGSVRELCKAGAAACQEKGYRPIVLADNLTCEAKDAGSFLGSIATYYSRGHEKVAFLAGGETIVKLIGKGKGGRNQEMAISAAKKIANLEDVAVFSFGSDGTDGPTDAAGGFVDGTTEKVLAEKGIKIDAVLANNSAYDALNACGGLLKTGATGTNVNDLSMVLIKR